MTPTRSKPLADGKKSLLMLMASSLCLVMVYVGIVDGTRVSEGRQSWRLRCWQRGFNPFYSRRNDSDCFNIVGGRSQALDHAHGITMMCAEVLRVDGGRGREEAVRCWRAELRSPSDTMLYQRSRPSHGIQSSDDIKSGSQTTPWVGSQH